jgi:hypothetical protein
LRLLVGDDVLTTQGAARDMQSKDEGLGFGENDDDFILSIEIGGVNPDCGEVIKAQELPQDRMSRHVLGRPHTPVPTRDIRWCVRARISFGRFRPGPHS